MQSKFALNFMRFEAQQLKVDVNYAKTSSKNLFAVASFEMKKKKKKFINEILFLLRNLRTKKKLFSLPTNGLIFDKKQRKKWEIYFAVLESRMGRRTAHCVQSTLDERSSFLHICFAAAATELILTHECYEGKK